MATEFASCAGAVSRRPGTALAVGDDGGCGCVLSSAGVSGSASVHTTRVRGVCDGCGAADHVSGKGSQSGAGVRVEGRGWKDGPASGLQRQGRAAELLGDVVPSLPCRGSVVRGVSAG